MEQRLVIATQILSGLVSLDRVRPVRRRVGAVRHALQLADLLQLMHCQIPPLVLIDPLFELREQYGENVLDDEGETPCPCPAPRRRGRPAKRILH